MHNLITMQEGVLRKSNRQLFLKNKFKEYSLSCGGACAHVGLLPKGCGECFSSEIKPMGSSCSQVLGLKNVCNANCPYCFFEEGDGSGATRKVGNSVSFSEEDVVSRFQKIIQNPRHFFNEYNVIFDIQNNRNGSFLFTSFSFMGYACEPLLYSSCIKMFLEHFKTKLEPIILQHAKFSSVFKLYTNGSLLSLEMCQNLREWGINELRINVAAHHFSEQVYENIKAAVKIFPTVCVEVAAFPLYEKQLFSMLPILSDIGISNLILCQVKIPSVSRLLSIMNMLKAYDFYKMGPEYVFLDDRGLTENIIQRVLEEKYDISVLDCNCFALNYKPAGTIANPFFDNVIDVLAV